LSSRRRELLLVVASAFTELAALEADAASVAVSTSRELPADAPTRALFARACRSIPAARRQGKMWIVPRAAWERARRPRRAERARDRDEAALDLDASSSDHKSGGIYVVGQPGLEPEANGLRDLARRWRWCRLRLILAFVATDIRTMGHVCYLCSHLVQPHRRRDGAFSSLQRRRTLNFVPRAEPELSKSSSF